jgi:hypothetical protein
MTLPTNAAKRDAELTARLAKIGATFVHCHSSKYGNDPTSYTIYAQFPNDRGPKYTYRDGKEVTPYYGYALNIKSRADLDMVTDNPTMLHNVYRQIRWDYHYKERKIDELNRNFYYEHERYTNLLGNMALQQLRGVVVDNLAEIMTQRDKTKIAVDAYDQAVAQLKELVGDQIPGENYRPRY